MSKAESSKPPLVEPPDVFILGAGFSRAIDAYMPLLPELSQRTLESYKDAAAIPAELRGMLAENIEEGLSYLAAAKPWLRESELLRHRALYLEVSQVVAYVLLDAVGHTVRMMATEAPAWLINLLIYWHTRRSVVVSLNYDTLIETVGCEIEFPPGSKVHPMDTHVLYPPFFTDAAVRSGTILFGERVPSFELLKLHGSINWFYSGLSSSRGETIYYVPPQGPGQIWNDQDETARLRRAAVQDKYPLIVPPVFDKASLLTHETIQSIWFRAGQALEKAGRVTFMGYSLPRSDMTMKHFLASSINPDAKIEVVDRSEGVVGHLTGMLKLNQKGVSSLSGEDCIQKYATKLVADAPSAKIAGSSEQ